MRRIILSLVTILASVAMVAGATKAVFSDTKSIDGNTVATGTLKLTLNHSTGKPFSIQGAYPGFVSGWEYMDIYNQFGTLPFVAKMSLAQTGGDPTLWNYVRIEMKTSGNDSDCTNGDAGEKTIWNSLINTFPNGITVSDIAYWHLASNGKFIIPGYSERICQRVGIDNSADNTVQGKSVTFSEIVDATQD